MAAKGGFRLIAELIRRQILQYKFGTKAMAASITWLISFEKTGLRVVSAITRNPP